MSNKSKGKPLARVLLVEDEEGARTALAKILQSYRYEVVAVEDGERAQDEFGAGDGFDLVITDLTLPGMSGWDVAKAVKAVSPATPVMVLSGWGISKNDEHIADSGVSMVLSKPVRVREMVAAVENLLIKASEAVKPK